MEKSIVHDVSIFVNYRREDSESITGRIDDHLRKAFGDEDVFRDIDSIPPGVDFVEHLQDAMMRCDLCIAVLGKRWVSERLNEPNDFVRLELETALRRKIPIIPVLVETASMPTPLTVPPSLHLVLRRQALRVDSGRDFRAHVARLVEAIQRVRKRRAELSPEPPSMSAPDEADADSNVYVDLTDDVVCDDVESPAESSPALPLTPNRFPVWTLWVAGIAFMAALALGSASGLSARQNQQALDVDSTGGSSATAVEEPQITASSVAPKPAPRVVPASKPTPRSAPAPAAQLADAPAPQPTQAAPAPKPKPEAQPLITSGVAQCGCRKDDLMCLMNCAKRHAPPEPAPAPAPAPAPRPNVGRCGCRKDDLVCLMNCTR